MSTSFTPAITARFGLNTAAATVVLTVRGWLGDYIKSVSRIVAEQLTIDMTNPVYKGIWEPAYSYIGYQDGVGPFVAMIDPDVVEPFFAVWISKCVDAGRDYSWAAGEPFFNACTSVGLDSDAAKCVWAATNRCIKAGKLNASMFRAVSTPAQVQKENKSDPSIIEMLKDAAKAQLTFVRYIPWVGAGVGTVVLLAYLAPSIVKRGVSNV